MLQIDFCVAFKVSCQWFHSEFSVQIVQQNIIVLLFFLYFSETVFISKQNVGSHTNRVCFNTSIKRYIYKSETISCRKTSISRKRDISWFQLLLAKNLPENVFFERVCQIKQTLQVSGKKTSKNCFFFLQFGFIQAINHLIKAKTNTLWLVE